MEVKFLGWVGALVGASILVVSGLSATPATAADTITCDGPEGSYEIPAETPCSAVLSAGDLAAQFAGRYASRTSDPDRFRREIETYVAGIRASRTADQLGTVFGGDAWACANGFTIANSCSGSSLVRQRDRRKVSVLTATAPGTDYAHDGEAAVVLQRGTDGYGNPYEYFALVAVIYWGEPGDQAIAPPKEALDAEAREILDSYSTSVTAFTDDYCSELESIAGIIP